MPISSPVRRLKIIDTASSRAGPQVSLQRALDQRVIGLVPFLHRREQGVARTGRRIGPEDLLGEGVEGGVIAGQRSHGPIEVGEECLEVDDRRTAVDPIGSALHLDLPGMAGRTGHADHLPGAVPATVKPTGRPSAGALGLGK